MPTNYGTDISTFTSPDGRADLDPNFTKISGARVPLERLARKLQTPGGSMLKAGWGYDVRDLLQGSLTPAEVAAAAGEIEQQCLDEEEVSTVNVDIPPLGPDRTLRITIRVELAEGEVFDLIFVLTPDNVQTIINAITEES